MTDYTVFESAMQFFFSPFFIIMGEFNQLNSSLQSSGNRITGNPVLPDGSASCLFQLMHISHDDNAQSISAQHVRVLAHIIVHE